MREAPEQTTPAIATWRRIEAVTVATCAIAAALVAIVQAVAWLVP